MLSNISIFFTTVILKIIDQNVDKCRRRKERLAGPNYCWSVFLLPPLRARIVVVSILLRHLWCLSCFLVLFSFFFLILLIVPIFAFKGEILLWYSKSLIAIWRMNWYEQICHSRLISIKNNFFVWASKLHIFLNFDNCFLIYLFNYEHCEIENHNILIIKACNVFINVFTFMWSSCKIYLSLY